MRKLMVIGILLICCLIMGCSKGNVISGSTVVDVTEEQAKNTQQIKEDVEASEQETSTDGNSGSGATGTVAAEVVEAPDYSAQKGTCTKDSIGVVRVIDDDGKKAVYRGECLGGLLVKYDCTENGQLDTTMERCSGECVVENRKAKCA